MQREYTLDGQVEPKSASRGIADAAIGGSCSQKFVY